jgi:ribonuclease HIII
MARAAEQWEISLALGAGPPVLEAGRMFLERHGAQELCKVAKIHFKTTNQLTNDRME